MCVILKVNEYLLFMKDHKGIPYLNPSKYVPFTHVPIGTNIFLLAASRFRLPSDIFWFLHFVLC